MLQMYRYKPWQLCVGKNSLALIASLAGGATGNPGNPGVAKYKPQIMRINQCIGKQLRYFSLRVHGKAEQTV